MHSIPNAVDTEQLADCVFFSGLRCTYFRVIASTYGLETSYNILLPNFHHNARSTNHLIQHLRVISEDSFIEFKKVISSVSIKEEGLEGRDFETVL